MQASKAHWGYSEAQLLAWQDDLTLDESHWEQHVLWAVMLDEDLAGFYSLAFAERQSMSSKVKMENLFIDPNLIGKGLGRALFEHAVARAKEWGSLELWLEADPHAEAFYAYLGMKKTGLVPGASPGRYLPLMILNLA